MNTLPPIHHFQPWNDDGEGYKFCDFVDPVSKPVARQGDSLTLSAPIPRSTPKLAFQPWTGDDEGYTFKGFV